ncbi:type II 3-dehydroquinate dehydratase [Thermanaerovibrio acidaminovorans]|uniref:3-dehydroquinate dehydratase n=1 Tax=Thermanaerovibrio acidaminovorans (strain ATCC 49978 / DSM 6589 / Su883) TaxID=525903 RepID=D1B756_THEAS|nr:type II 3-dehydroquinate dehydratase [Thermanaerovibrio acidaminovorans]ACZ19847.1 3-dehydroquinate dehydratase, type II [Thermanaerovibrio acidaminovorans DSM 6589]
MRYHVINGPNMNMLGRREAIYGSVTLAEVEAMCRRWGEEMGVGVECFQSNHEGELVEAVHRAYGSQGLVINGAGYGYTSVALRDAVSACPAPVVEVHMTNVAAREAFRRESLLTPVVRGLIMGFGARVYLLALEALRGE